MIRIYGLKNCDTCRKALKAFSAANIDAQLIDVREHPPSKTRLQTWLKIWGADKLVNRRSSTWRQLDSKVRESLSEQSAVSLLLEHPALMKRPICESAQHQTLGLDADTVKSFSK